MQHINFKTHSKEDTDTKADILTKVNEIFKNQLAQAFEHEYHINDESADLLQDLFEHRMVIQSPTARLKESSHPILAILNQFSNYDAHAQINRARAQGAITMTVGDSANGKLRAAHNCLLLNDARDNYRVGANNAPIDLHNFSAGKSDRALHCSRGTQNCHFQANIAYAVHSMYDMTPTDVALLFSNHNIDRLVSYMYFPLSIYDRRLVKHDLSGFNLRFIDDDQVLFSMKDFSAPYIHSYKQWYEWAVISKIETPHFDINIEHVRNYGPLHVLNFVRCRKSPKIMPVYVPITKYAGDLYLIPNVYHALLNSFAYPQAKTPHFIAPATFVDPLLGTILTSFCEFRQNKILAIALN